LIDNFEFDSKNEKLAVVDEIAYKKFRIIYGICQVIDNLDNYF